MLCVAIVRNVGAGQEPTEEFRLTETAADALNQFVTEVPSIYNTTDYTAFDTGWDASVQFPVPYPSSGNRWAWDFGISQMVEVPIV